jgi:hypothetical protein
MDKKGQGLSLNVIIVAALALIVLVVLVVVFTGRIAIFTEGVGGESKAKMDTLKPFYGDCHPNAIAENGFGLEFSDAAKLENTNEASVAKAQAEAKFNEEISRCKGYSDKDNCDSDSNCAWK